MKRPAFERMIGKVVINAEGCWVFRGALSCGYGSIGSDDRRDRTVYTHRLSYETLVGPIPPGLHIDHLCRNRACCNPEHLQVVTQRENILRGNSRMAQGAKKTHCLHGHPLSGENLYLQGRHRSCKTCRDLRNKSRSLKNSAAQAQAQAEA